MSNRLVDVKSDALSLPESERAELAKDLLVSLDEVMEPNVKKTWDVEICRRLNEIESGSVELIDAEAALAKVKRRLKLN